MGDKDKRVKKLVQNLRLLAKAGVCEFCEHNEKAAHDEPCDKCCMAYSLKYEAR